MGVGMACFLNMCSDADADTKHESVQRFRRQYEELNDTNETSTDGPLLYAKDEEICRLTRKNESLRRQLADIELDVAEKTKKYSFYKQHADELEQQMEQMRREYDEEHKHNMNHDYEQQLIAVTNEKASLSQQIRKLDQTLMETHQRSELFEIEIAELKQKQSVMMANAEQIQQEKDGLELEIVGLKGSISELENQRNTLLSQLEISQSTDKIKECQIQNMMQKVAKQTEIERALDQAMNESSDIKKQNESLETKVSEKDKEIKIIRKTSDSAIADLAQKVVEIESFITKCDAQTAQLKVQEDRIQGDGLLIQILTTERDEIQLRCKGTAQLIEQYKQQIDELQSKSRKQEEDSKITEQTTQIQSAQIQELNNEIISLNATTKALQETLQSTVSHLSKSGAEIISKEETNTTLETENTSLKARNESLMEQLRKMATEMRSRGKLENLQKLENDKLSDQIGDLNKEIASMSESKQILTQKLSSAEERITQTLDAQQRAENELITLRTIRKQYEIMEQQWRKKEKRRNSLESSHTALTGSSHLVLTPNPKERSNQEHAEIVKLKAEIASLKTSNVDLLNRSEGLTAQLSKSERFQKKMAAQLGAQSSNMEDMGDTQNTTMCSMGMSQIDEEKETPKTKKVKINQTATQIRIAMSEDAKARSMLLCCKPQTISKDGHEKEFGFLKFCKTHLSDKAVDQLFSKFKKHSIDATQLMSILTLTVIIYNVRLHQYQHGGTTKPKMDSNKIKRTVEHLAVYIVRKFGTRSEEKEDVKVMGDDGEEIKGRFYGFSCAVTKKQFSKHVAEWIESYLEDEGTIDIED